MAQPQTDKTGQIVPRTEIAPGDKMAVLIQKMTPELARALPKHVTADRMARIVLTAVRANPKLAETTPASFLGCVLSCAVLGLEPNTPLGLAYLIPRKNNKRGGVQECTMQIGYQGMIDLAGRAGVTVKAEIVRKGDDFRYSLGLEPTLHHVPSEDENRLQQPITHAYCVAITPDGRKSFSVLNKAEIEQHREMSPAKDEGPWVTHYADMACKTAVRVHFKWIPKSTERTEMLARAVALDEAPERAVPQLQAMDPAIQDALAAQGLDVDGKEVIEGADRPS